jgi:hypothetical protein
LADECFADVLSGLRRQGLVVCEFIKLAIDGVGRSRWVLASLFHSPFLYAHSIKNCDQVVIEGNPRHVRLYEKMLGFAVLAGERVESPGQRPRGLDVAGPWLRRATDLANSPRSGAHVTGERSLYRHCFTQQEAVGIVRRLRQQAAWSHCRDD